MNIQLDLYIEEWQLYLVIAIMYFVFYLLSFRIFCYMNDVSKSKLSILKKDSNNSSALKDLYIDIRIMTFFGIIWPVIWTIYFICKLFTLLSTIFYFCIPNNTCENDTTHYV